MVFEMLSSLFAELVCVPLFSEAGAEAAGGSFSGRPPSGCPSSFGTAVELAQPIFDVDNWLRCGLVSYLWRGAILELRRCTLTRERRFDVSL